MNSSVKIKKSITVKQRIIPSKVERFLKFQNLCREKPLCVDDSEKSSEKTRGQ
jgi:hypothetical protein